MHYDSNILCVSGHMYILSMLKIGVEYLERQRRIRDALKLPLKLPGGGLSPSETSLKKRIIPR